MGMQETIETIGRAKALIDAGMCRVGPGLVPTERGDALLAGGAGRALALADCVTRLCRHDHPGEALVLLRQLAETAVLLRWLRPAQEGGARRVEEAVSEGREPEWDGLWSSDRFRARAREAGVREEEVESILRLCADFARGGSTGAPWSHVFAENHHRPVEAERVLRLAARMMGHVLKALDTRWPGSFPAGDASWEG